MKARQTCASPPKLRARLKRLYRYFVPPLSRRDRFVSLSLRACAEWRDAGPGAALRHLFFYRRLPVWVEHGETYQQRRYQQWLAAQARELKALGPPPARSSPQPLISFLTTVTDSSAPLIRDSLDALARQTCACWEWCVAGGAVSLPIVAELRLHAAERRVTGRVRVVDGGLNEAWQAAAGELVLRLEAGSVLADELCAEIVRLLDERRDADIIYFDEDQLSADGSRCHSPFFKPDWSPELLLSVNYLRSAAVRRALVEAVGGFNLEMGNAAEWDLMLRCAEQAASIHHLPRVLLHVREGRKELPAPHCVAEYLRHRGAMDARAARDSAGRVVVSWTPRGDKVSIIIPTKDKVSLLKKCLDSLDRMTDYRNFEVVLVDSGSREAATLDYYKTLAADPRVRIIEYGGAARGRFNYSAANNLGARHAQGELLLFLNNDVEAIDAGWLTELVRWAERPEIGAVGARLLFPRGRIQHAGVIIGMGGIGGHVFAGGWDGLTGPFGSPDWYRNYFAVTGACMMMRRAVFAEVGGFDEGYELAFSDVEICVRLVEHGYRVLYTPCARLRHYEGGTRRSYTPRADILRAYARMGRIITGGDPYFNPNLSYRAVIPRLTGREERTPAEVMRGVVSRLSEDLPER